MAFELIRRGTIVGFGHGSTQLTTPVLQVEELFPTVQAVLDDAATNAIAPLFRMIHRTSATPVAGFGTEFQVRLHSNLNTERIAFQQQVSWTDATDAAPISKVRWLTNNAGTMTPWVELTGAGVFTLLAGATLSVAGASTFTGDVAFVDDVGFYGTAPVEQQVNATAANIAAIADSSAGATATQACVTAFALVLSNLGLCPVPA